MPRDKELDNFLEKSINDDYYGAILIICAPVSDDGDYEFMVHGAVHNALTPITKWFDENNIPSEMRISWGTPKLEDIDSHRFCVNVWVRPKERKFTKEEAMVFKLKFIDSIPITNLTKYIEEFLAQK